MTPAETLAALLLGARRPPRRRRRHTELNLYSARHYQTDGRSAATSPRRPASRSTASRAGRRASRAHPQRRAPTARPTCSSPSTPPASAADAAGVFAPVKVRRPQGGDPRFHLHRPLVLVSRPAPGSSFTTSSGVTPDQVRTTKTWPARPEGQVYFRRQPPYNLSSAPRVNIGTARPRMGPRLVAQLRPRAEGRRHRPDQGRPRCRQEVRRGAGEHLLPGGCSVRRPKTAGPSAHRRGVAQPGELQRTSTSPAAAC